MGHGWGHHTDSVGSWGPGRGSGGWQGFGSGFGGRGRPGPPPWLADLFGMGAPPERGPRARRGDVRAAILSVLAEAGAEQEINGYGVIQAIGERSGGAWRPSPGSVYPTISQLEDEGLVATEESRGRRVLRLTDDGATYAQENAGELAAVWDAFDTEPSASRGSRSGGAPDYAQLKPEIGQLMSAVWQIATQGTDRQRAEAISVLVETRRKLYGLLAADQSDEIEAEDDDA
jgi:DNA-binding PadR family transcriptional regulator